MNKKQIISIIIVLLMLPIVSGELPRNTAVIVPSYYNHTELIEMVDQLPTWMFDYVDVIEFSEPINGYNG